MLRLQRPQEPDELRRARSLRLAQVLLGQLDSREASDGGYNLDEVRTHLATAQNIRCAYCGIEISARGYHIEHLRPRNSHQPRHGAPDPLTHHDGYWWLTWTWENLWLSCPDCNGKGSRFALLPNARRLTPPTLTDIAGAFCLTDEDAKLLDPAVDNPPQHIMLVEDSIEGWHWEAVDGSERGRYTIDVLSLKARNWWPAGPFFQDAIAHLEHTLNTGAAGADVSWRAIQDDFLDPLTPYRDRLWWYLHHWYHALEAEHQAALGAMHPFPNAHLPPQPLAPHIAEWWPIPAEVDPAKHLRDWLDSVDRDVQIAARRDDLVARCALAPHTVAELEAATGATTVRADLDRLVEGGRLTRERQGRSYIYNAAQRQRT